MVDFSDKLEEFDARLEIKIREIEIQQKINETKRVKEKLNVSEELREMQKGLSEVRGDLNSLNTKLTWGSIIVLVIVAGLIFKGVHLYYLV